VGVRTPIGRRAGKKTGGVKFTVVTTYLTYFFFPFFFFFSLRHEKNETIFHEQVKK
jgi:hypothetical protein